MTITAYPLAWPPGRPRVVSHKRQRAAWRSKGERVTVAEGKRRIYAELERFGAASCVLSSNLLLNLDGTPKRAQPEPADPGVAVYFQMDRRDYIMACDKWDRAADNITAIAHHIAALRAQLRYGIQDARGAFAGFASLPSPESMNQWRQVFGYTETDAPTLDDVRERHKRLRSIQHPDKGGSAEQFNRLQKALEVAEAELA